MKIESTAFIIVSTIVVICTIAAHYFADSCGMNFVVTDSIVLRMFLLVCSFIDSMPGATLRSSFSSPSFFYGYQNRACSYIL